MPVYKLKANENTYDIIDLDISVLSTKLVETSKLSRGELIHILMALPYENTSLKSIWPNIITCNYFGKSKKQNYDINIYTNYIVFKMNAYNLLKGELEPYGEFLPLDVEGDKMMMFNLLTFAEEQKDLCKISYLDGIKSGIDVLHFNENDTANKPIFKSKMEGGMSIYCTDKLKNIIEENVFTGVRFDLDLVSPF